MWSHCKRYCQRLGRGLCVLGVGGRWLNFALHWIHCLSPWTSVKWAHSAACWKSSHQWSCKWRISFKLTQLLNTRNFITSGSWELRHMLQLIIHLEIGAQVLRFKSEAKGTWLADWQSGILLHFLNPFWEVATTSPAWMCQNTSER